MLVSCPNCKKEFPVHQKPRSIPQNKYYWDVVVGLISETTGFTAQEAHDALKLKFLRVVKGKMETVRSTTDLTTKEFEDYVSQIRVFASQELACYIPEPNSPSELLTNEFK